MRIFLPPVRRPRHPLARLLMAVLGLAVLGVFMVFGLFAMAVFIAVGGILFLVRWWGQRHAARAAPAGGHGDVIEGEFVIVHEHRRPPPH